MLLLTFSIQKFTCALIVCYKKKKTIQAYEFSINQTKFMMFGLFAITVLHEFEIAFFSLKNGLFAH